MNLLVGSDRRAIVDRLAADFDAVSAGGGPLAVSLEAPLGLGKTRLVQELYGRLATSRQGPVAYWPASLDWQHDSAGDTRRDILQTRKQVEPTPGWVIPGGVDIPWLWWGINCQLTHAGSPMRAMKDASDQLRAHLDPMLEKLERSNRNRDDALELLSGLFDLTGVVSPGSAVDGFSKFLNVFRRRVRQDRAAAAVSMDRRLETGGESYAEAGRIAESLTAVSRTGTPIVLVVDDAQWADPALVSLLRHLIGLSGAPILLVTTAGPEGLAAQAGRGAGTFADWLETTGAEHPARLERIALEPLPDADLAEMVLETAARTPPDTVREIAAIASGSPLALNLLLDLDVIRRDVAADGSIDTDPAVIARLPGDLRTIYRDLWRQLPDPVRRVLALAAVEGPEFLPGVVPRAAIRLGMHDELTLALAEAKDRYRWIRSVNDDRWEFAERQRFDIADDALPEVYPPEQQRLVRLAIVDEVVALKASERWAELDAGTRRIALESHLEANEQLGEEADRDLAAVADSMLQLASLELESENAARARELADAAVVAFEGVPSTDDSVARSRAMLARTLADAARPTAPVPEPAEVSGVGADATEETDALGRIPWTGWAAHPVPALTEVAPSEVAVLIAEVVAAEGPVFAGRVYDLLRAASGAGRLGQTIRAALDAGVRTAVRRGEIVATVPDARGGSVRRVLRLTSQPEVILRTLGDRTIDQVPSSEVTELARRVLRQEPFLSRDELKRRLVPLLGGKLLTSGVDDLLEAALPASFGFEPVPPHTDEWGRVEWVGWTPRPLPDPTGLRPAEVAVLVAEVVDDEGPVMLGRVFDLIREASGAPRLSPALRRALEAGVASGERKGDLVLARGRRGEPDTRTVRLAGQPEVVLRTPGPRDLWMIPPAELAALARAVQAANPGIAEDEVKRIVASLVGVGRYTKGADAVLESALATWTSMDTRPGSGVIDVRAGTPITSRRTPHEH